MDNAPHIHTGLQTLSVLVDSITQPIFSRYRGYLEARLITDWAFIAGHKLSMYTVPRKIIFQDKDNKTNGVLHLDVLSSAVAVEVSYMMPVLLEKIAIYMGYKAIAHIRTHLRPSPLAAVEVRDDVMPQLSPEKTLQLQETVQAIDDIALRETLYRLGHYVLAEHQEK